MEGLQGHVARLAVVPDTRWGGSNGAGVGVGETGEKQWELHLSVKPYQAVMRSSWQQPCPLPFAPSPPLRHRKDAHSPRAAATTGRLRRCCCGLRRTCIALRLSHTRPQGQHLALRLGQETQSYGYKDSSLKQDKNKDTSDQGTHCAARVELRRTLSESTSPYASGQIPSKPQRQSVCVGFHSPNAPSQHWLLLYRKGKH